MILDRLEKTVSCYDAFKIPSHGVYMEKDLEN